MNKTNYCVIMAGGIGSRFWPVSTPEFPKQFLDITNVGKSLIKQTYNRFAKIIPDNNIYIVTNEEHLEIAKQQIPSIPTDNIITEPMRRNTAPCIAYAMFKIKKENPNANIVVTPADHLIVDEDMFLKNIDEGLKFAKSGTNLITLGIKPDRPATSYGYIQINNSNTSGNFLQVKTFTEKPHLELAKFFIKSEEFLWNSGIFIWQLKSIETAFKDFLPEMYNIFSENEANFNTEEEKSAINRIYSEVKSISIDFGIMEKAENVFVLPVDFGWSDLGTWNSLYSIGKKDENLNVKIAEKIVLNNSERNYINIRGEKLVVLDGIEDFIIVNTDQALLICKRENEENVKELLNQAKFKYGENTTIITK
jgi:mannose-1-phosphate guanylyltransferase